MEAVIKAKPWLKDPLAVHKKWDEEEYALRDRDNGQKLCFAIMWDDGVCIPHPPVTRALKQIQAVLTKAGHNGALTFMQFSFFLLTCHGVIAWHPFEHKKLGDLTVCDIWCLC